VVVLTSCDCDYLKHVMYSWLVKLPAFRQKAPEEANHDPDSERHANRLPRIVFNAAR